MIEIKQFWIDGTPKLDDIKQAFEIVKQSEIVVELRWSVPYSGNYNKLIGPSQVNTMTAEDYFKHHIPHVYGV